jgi:hypothetical protein
MQSEPQRTSTASHPKIRETCPFFAIIANKPDWRK